MANVNFGICDTEDTNPIKDAESIFAISRLTSHNQAMPNTFLKMHIKTDPLILP